LRRPVDDDSLIEGDTIRDIKFEGMAVHLPIGGFMLTSVGQREINTGRQGNHAALQSLFGLSAENGSPSSIAKQDDLGDLVSLEGVKNIRPDQKCALLSATRFWKPSTIF